MQLTPREKDKLLVAMAAEVARKRLARGVKLNHPEAIALITDAVVEGARDGRSVAEMVFGEMICLARRIFGANDAGRRHLWTKDNKRRFELKGKAVSIIGLGNIGKQVAQMAEAFGMEYVAPQIAAESI